MNFGTQFFHSCITVAQEMGRGSPISPNLPSPPTSDSGPWSVEDFYGFPSHPTCIYRTGDKWPVSEGPYTRRVPREARPPCNHPIQAVWRTLGVEVYEYLDSLGILWSTIDPVHFAEEKGEAGPLYLWVGVIPGSLSLEVAKTAAVGCKKILAAAQFSNIEIAFRESVFTRSAGPQLIDHVPVGFEDHTADIRGPFTGSLGVQIARLDTPYFEGTGALYICEGDRVFLLTARHVVLPPKLHKNDLYHYKCDSQPRHDVLILGNNAYQDAVRDIMAKIGHELYYVTLYERRLAVMGEAVDGEDARAADGRQALKGKLAMAEETIMAVKEFHDDITEHWNTESCRILGHVFYAPPISVGTSPKEFTEDWALIELNRNMIDWDIFKGNVVYLGNKISSNDFNIKMRSEGHSFEYPLDGLLQVKGIIEEEEIIKNREKCLLVIKNGKGTGVTIGRESGIESFTRVYGDHGIKSTSREIAIYSYSRKESPFSDEGDSGSIVVDGLGRIVGMITGGAGLKNALDVTYATPYFWLEKQIKKAFPDSYLWQ